MATTIKTIPILTGKVARKFIKNAEEAYSKRYSIDFSEQLVVAKKILSKSFASNNV